MPSFSSLLRIPKCCIKLLSLGYEIFQENGIEVKIFEGVKSLSFNWIFRKRGKYIKDRAYQRLNELNKLLKGGE